MSKKKHKNNVEFGGETNVSADTFASEASIDAYVNSLLDGELEQPIKEDGSFVLPESVMDELLIKPENEFNEKIEETKEDAQPLSEVDKKNISLLNQVKDVVASTVACELAEDLLRHKTESCAEVSPDDGNESSCEEDPKPSVKPINYKFELLVDNGCAIKLSDDSGLLDPVCKAVSEIYEKVIGEFDADEAGEILLLCFRRMIMTRVPYASCMLSEVKERLSSITNFNKNKFLLVSYSTDKSDDDIISLYKVNEDSVSSFSKMVDQLFECGWGNNSEVIGILKNFIDYCEDAHWLMNEDIDDYISTPARVDIYFKELMQDEMTATSASAEWNPDYIRYKVDDDFDTYLVDGEEGVSNDDNPFHDEAASADESGELGDSGHDDVEEEVQKEIKEVEEVDDESGDAETDQSEETEIESIEIEEAEEIDFDESEVDL